MMKTFDIVTESYMRGSKESTKKFKFLKESDRDKYFDRLIDYERNDENNKEIKDEFHRNDIIFVDSCEKWYYHYRKTESVILIVESINDDGSLNCCKGLRSS